MKKKLTVRDYIYIGSMLFGMFFGAGNLIFPVLMGQLSGSNVWLAIFGFLITGVGLPLLGVAALGISKSDGLYELSIKAGRPYAMFFTLALYLTIGPFFAIPRCATTSFTVGLEQLIPSDEHLWLYLLIFSIVFFTVALILSLYPGKILTWIGKILNPIFLLFLAILVIVVIFTKTDQNLTIEPTGNYITKPFMTGFLEGYNTMDALASLAFGIVVVKVIYDLGVEDENVVAKSTLKSGIISCVLMAVIYVAVTFIGVRSRYVLEPAENGGAAFAQIAEYYLGKGGLIILAIMVTVACLKTAIGLITSCSEMFTTIFPKGPCYKVWVYIFSAISFTLANLGLSSIIKISIPVLMFLYPLAIVLILLALFGKLFNNSKIIYKWTIGFTIIGAVYDFCCALPADFLNSIHLVKPLEFIRKILPLSQYGLGWICPTLVGLFIGIVILLFNNTEKKDKIVEG